MRLVSRYGFLMSCCHMSQTPLFDPSFDWTSLVGRCWMVSILYRCFCLQRTKKSIKFIVLYKKSGCCFRIGLKLAIPGALNTRWICSYCVFSKSRVINVLLTEFARDRTGRISALGLSCTDLAASGSVRTAKTSGRYSPSTALALGQ